MNNRLQPAFALTLAGGSAELAEVAACGNGCALRYRMACSNIGLNQDNLTARQAKSEVNGDSSRFVVYRVHHENGGAIEERIGRFVACCQFAAMLKALDKQAEGYREEQDAKEGAQ